MKNPRAMDNLAIRVPLAGLLGWILPGAGHIFIGERVRGVILMSVIAITFWSGVAVGGIKNTVNPADRSLWFIGQICTGGHALSALALSRMVEDPDKSGADPTTVIAFGRAEEISVVYTAICGMLNVLIILDVMVRAEKLPAAKGRGPPRTRR